MEKITSFRAIKLEIYPLQTIIDWKFIFIVIFCTRCLFVAERIERISWLNWVPIEPKHNKFIASHSAAQSHK